MSIPFRIEPFGDAALLVAVDGPDPAARAARSAALAAALRDRLPARSGWADPVPGIGGVLVPFDAETLRLADAADTLADLLEDAASATRREPGGRNVEIPVRYGGAEGPDLSAVAEAAGVSADELVRIHAGATYRVLVLGFLPGFAYLGALPPPLAAIPRRSTPRTRVPAGSVAIAAGLTGVYPVDSPGGWHVLGRTDAVLWDPGGDPPNRLAPGDRVRFVPAASGR